MAGEFQLQAYEARWREEWNECVRASRQRHVFFERGFLEYHGERFQDVSWLLRYRGRVIGVLPLAVEGVGWGSHPGLPFGGWIVRREFSYAQMTQAFDLLAKAMRERGVKQLIYRVTPFPYRQECGEEDVFELERRGASALPMKATCLMELVDDEWQKATSRDLRRGLARAHAVGLEWMPDVSLEEVYDLVMETLWRRHEAKPLHSIEDLRKIEAAFPGLVKAVGVGQGGKLVAGQILFISEHVVRLQLVGYREDAPHGALLKLNDGIKQQWKGAGRWLDFGTSMEPATGELNASLVHFKEKSGGRLSVQRSYLWTPNCGKGGEE